MYGLSVFGVTARDRPCLLCRCAWRVFVELDYNEAAGYKCPPSLGLHWNFLNGSGSGLLPAFAKITDGVLGKFPPC